MHGHPLSNQNVTTAFETRILAGALRTNIANDGMAGELIMVDPNRERLSSTRLGNVATAIAAPVQHLDTNLFLSLQPVQHLEYRPSP